MAPTELAVRDISFPSLDAAAMHRLLRAVRDLAGCRDVAAIVEVVRHAARALVNADGATFVLRDGDQCYYVDEDAIEPLWRGQRFPLEACISGWSMLHEQQVVIPDIYSDGRIPHEAYRPTFVQSLVMTPIRTRSAIGSIGTYWAESHTATPEEQELLQALADSTAVALENARTLEDLESKVAERTAEIAASNQDLAAFAHVAAHDLKEPLTTIVGHAELIADAEPGLDGDSAASLAAVRRQAARMVELIDGVLAYSGAATSSLDVQRVDLNRLVADVVDGLAGLLERRGAEVMVGDLPVVIGSPQLLERVVQNLLTNAVNYGDPTRPQVVVEGRCEGGSALLSVSDNGSGVPAAERERIFDMFSRGSTSRRAPGSGIGLAFARRAVLRHGGQLTVGEGPNGGAAFTVRLPGDPAEATAPAEPAA